MFRPWSKIMTDPYNPYNQVDNFLYIPLAENDYIDFRKFIVYRNKDVDNLPSHSLVEIFTTPPKEENITTSSNLVSNNRADGYILKNGRKVSSLTYTVSLVPIPTSEMDSDSIYTAGFTYNWDKIKPITKQIDQLNKTISIIETRLEKVNSQVDFYALHGVDTHKSKMYEKQFIREQNALERELKHAEKELQKLTAQTYQDYFVRFKNPIIEEDVKTVRGKNKVKKVIKEGMKLNTSSRFEADAYTRVRFYYNPGHADKLYRSNPRDQDSFRMNYNPKTNRLYKVVDFEVDGEKRKGYFETVSDYVRLDFSFNKKIIQSKVNKPIKFSQIVNFRPLSSPIEAGRFYNVPEKKVANDTIRYNSKGGKITPNFRWEFDFDNSTEIPSIFLGSATQHYRGNVICSIPGELVKKIATVSSKIYQAKEQQVGFAHRFAVDPKHCALPFLVRDENGRQLTPYIRYELLLEGDDDQSLKVSYGGRESYGVLKQYSFEKNPNFSKAIEVLKARGYELKAKPSFGLELLRKDVKGQSMPSWNGDKVTTAVIDY